MSKSKKRANDAIYNQEAKTITTMTGKVIDVSQHRALLMVNEKEVIARLPEVNMEPASDRVLLYPVPIQMRVSHNGLLIPAKSTIMINNKVEQVSIERYFIVAVGAMFSELVTKGSGIELKRGDEVCIASHLDGIPHMPKVTDPSLIEPEELVSLHYTEIVGYIKHVE